MGWLQAVTFVASTILFVASGEGSQLRGVLHAKRVDPERTMFQEENHRLDLQGKLGKLAKTQAHKVSKRTDQAPDEDLQEPKEESKDGSKQELKEDSKNSSKDEPGEQLKDEPIEEVPVRASEEKDVSAAGISPLGEHMIKEMVADEEDETRVIQTPEQKAEAKLAAQHEPEDPFEIAQRRLFDEPAEHKLEEAMGEKEEEEVYHVDADHEFGHKYHQGHLHPKDDRLDQRVRVLLWVTPVFVFSNVAYFFCISKVKITEEILDMRNGGLTQKLHTSFTGWRRVLGKVVEHPFVNLIILIGIFVDIICAGIHDTLNTTDLLNPKYTQTSNSLIHLTHTTSIYLLCAFLVEQMLHIICFGKAFFYHFWYIMDLTTVYVSLVGETILHEKFGDVVSFLILMRLWKVICVVFDLSYALQETAHMTEKIEKKKEKMRVASPI